MHSIQSEKKQICIFAVSLHISIRMRRRMRREPVAGRSLCGICLGMLFIEIIITISCARIAQTKHKLEKQENENNEKILRRRWMDVVNSLWECRIS